MLDVVAGYNPADPITAFSAGRVPSSYMDALTKDGLKARIGLLIDFLGSDPVHQPVNAVVAAAVEKMTAMGATIVRVDIPGLNALTRDLSLINLEFPGAFNAYLVGLGPGAP